VSVSKPHFIVEDIMKNTYVSIFNFDMRWT